MKRILIALCGLGLAAGMTACASTGSTDAGTTPAPSITAPATTAAPAAKTTPSPHVSKGLALKDASADVKVGKLIPDSVLPGFGKARVIVTNHSSKRSNYVISVAAESADGKTQLDTSSVIVQNLDPGQSSRQSAQFFQLPKHLPKGAKVVLQEVQRNSAI